ncbi:src-like-adapter 2 [Syngnathoides biaculeatus]|uniref:src-like-adapter 2 n=1 Tax=Syngnathoides biaculeatus TaxID=300417 RepID=UPI002ADE6519|nr:src-like-adapter 2 [Syngnathoides biaculeatus]
MGLCPSRCSSDHRALENPPEPPSSVSEEPLIVSLFDFLSFDGTELLMTIGERLGIISDDGNVLRVRSTTTSREMYVPNNYTAKVTQRWLFTGVSRLKAEELLMQPQNHIGGFLIRESETNADCFSLSVRWRVSALYSDCVKHYLIFQLQNGRVYITPKRSFSSLKRLVEHYSESAEGLCCQLTEPCFIQGLDVSRENTLVVPPVHGKPTNNWKDISRSMILKRTRTGSENSLVSEGLREAISSYLQMTEGNNQCWDT